MGPENGDEFTYIGYGQFWGSILNLLAKSSAALRVQCLPVLVAIWSHQLVVCWWISIYLHIIFLVKECEGCILKVCPSTLGYPGPGSSQASLHRLNSRLTLREHARESEMWAIHSVLHLHSNRLMWCMELQQGSPSLWGRVCIGRAHTDSWCRIVSLFEPSASKP